MTNWDEYRADAEKAQQAGNWSYAERLWRDALVETVGWSETDRRKTFTIEKLCECLWRQNKFAEANNVYQQLVSISMHLMGDDHLNTACLVGNLAKLYHAAHDYEQALPLYQQAIAVKIKHLGHEHPEVKQLEDALVELSGKIEIKQKYTRVIRSRMWTIADTLEGMPDVNQDKPIIKPNVVDLIAQWDSITSKAEALNLQGQITQAITLWQQALPIAENINDRNYRLCLALQTLAMLLEGQKKFKEAASYVARALAISRKVLSDNHPSVANSLDTMARLHYYSCEYSEAEQNAHECLSITVRLYGQDHPSVATAASNLAMLCHLQAKFTEAESLYRRVLETRTKTLGSNHPDTVKALKEFARILDETHRADQVQHFDNRATGMTLARK